MTLRIQPPGLPDRILAMLGKRRPVFIPAMTEKYGTYIARRENFFRALFRPRHMQPPDGWVYFEESDKRTDNNFQG
jgi:hypothetical protein